MAGLTRGSMEKTGLKKNLAFLMHAKCTHKIRPSITQPVANAGIFIQGLSLLANLITNKAALAQQSSRLPNCCHHHPSFAVQ